jgi:hypothetical protein
MTLAALQIYPGVNSHVAKGGRAVVAVPAYTLGGYVVNPASYIDQGISTVEVLFVDPTGPAVLHQTATTVPLQPGQSYRVPADQTTPLWINAASSGHRFSAILLQPPVPGVTPIPGAFPPIGPTGLINVIPSYLYEQYNDDDDLQAFVASFNALAQNYVDTFNALNLPVYTGTIIAGALLDWVAQGLYGMARPALSSGRVIDRGPFNTYLFNAMTLNHFQVTESSDVVVTDDDIFKRILTWHLYKGDGKVFSIRWLKRRIMRFLLGTNGTAPNVDDSYQLSVTFGPNYGVSIRLLTGVRTITAAATFNSLTLNTMRFNETNSQFAAFTPLPNAAIFKEAVDSGALELPFQFNYTVTI